MKSKAKLLMTAAGLIVIGVILGLVLSSSLGIHTRGYSEEYKVSEQAVETLSKISNAMAELSQAVKPTVVNISTTRKVKVPGVQTPFFDDPLFRRFFGERFREFEEPRERKTMSLGSGVIVDKRGIILTNNHVVKSAEEITVILFDKREFKGKIIGSDAKTDLAVIKIEAENLPVIKWGDSDKLRVGETIVAIGNPYGLSQTITSGIVSAVGRANVGIADYEDFIQTDAAINPGNSGGALVNARGELVGINTAIFSTTGGYQGIGFAIPSNMARVVMDSLIEKGKVVRGWLGIWIQPLSPELAKQFAIKDDKGALVADVVEGSPAELSGIRRGDFIVSYNGKPVEEPTALRNMVANTPPQQEVAIKLIRDGKELSVKVKIAEQPEEEAAIRPEITNALAGVLVQDLTPNLRRNMRLPERIHGVIVTNIEETSPAAGILKSEDIIMEANRKRTKNLQEYSAVVKAIEPDESVLLLIYRAGSVFYLTIPPK